jgi:hypothetical protein
MLQIVEKEESRATETKMFQELKTKLRVKLDLIEMEKT